MESLTLRDALLIGLGQTLALVPGVCVPELPSPPACHRPAARRSRPLLVSAVDSSGGCCGCLRASQVAAQSRRGNLALLTGLAAAGVSGYLCIRWLLRQIIISRFIPITRRCDGGISRHEKRPAPLDWEHCVIIALPSAHFCFGNDYYYAAALLFLLIPVCAWLPPSIRPKYRLEIETGRC